jgi:carbohydrate esterase family 4 protein, putative polysaccharide deacetylase
MKRFFQILGICSILVFSFYYTDKIALIVQEKNPILQEIKSKENELLIDSKDATVVNNFIIPGIKGSKVNVEKSFNKMKSLNAFNEYYLVYDDVKPSISIEDNKDKIIISGNKSKKQISVIIEYNEDLINYFRNYKIDLLINKNNYDKKIKFELINNEKDVKKFKQVETLLNNDKINKKLCLYNQSNQDICKSKGNYIIKNTHYLNNNIYDIKNTLENGSIILIKKDTNLKDIKILLNQIKFQDLEIVYLSDLIKE